MTRWRVDFRVKSDVVLAKDQKTIIFAAPDNTHEIHLFTRRGEGKHAVDELYLSAHVILEGENAFASADRAETYLRQFLEILAIATSGSYRLEQRILVADWTAGLTNRRFWHFKKFPDPRVPIYALRQDIIESIKTLTASPIPTAVRLAMQWWARGVSAGMPHEQFQFFWYALEIIADYSKPSIRVPSKCASCSGDLFCRTCNVIPLHRPYPKQAIKMLIEKHVRTEPQRFFAVIDDATNRLLHGDDPENIARDLDASWDRLSDSLGKTTWAAILGVLVNIAAPTATEGQKLNLLESNSFMHYHVTSRTEISMGAAHADPNNPQIEEFLPSFQLNMIVSEHDEADRQQGPRP
jgi:hypothetical protein